MYLVPMPTPESTWGQGSGICKIGLNQSELTLGIGHQSTGVMWRKGGYVNENLLFLGRGKGSGYQMDKLGISTTWCIFLNLQTQGFLHLGGNFSSHNLWVIFSSIFWILYLRDTKNLSLFWVIFVIFIYFTVIVLISALFLCISWDYPKLFIFWLVIWYSAELVFNLFS